MVDVPEPVMRFGVALAVAVLWVAKGYALSVYRGERGFRVAYAGKTLLLGIVAGAIEVVVGGDVATAAVIAVPFVDDIWNRFSSTWNRLEDLPVVERFEVVANQLIGEYGDDAAAKMDETRKRLTGDNPAAAGGFEYRAPSPPGGVVIDESKMPNPPGETVLDDDQPASGSPFDGKPASGGTDGGIDATPAERVTAAVNAVPDTYDGWLKLRAVAGQIPAIDGNGSRDVLRQKLRNYADSQTVLDAFATVEARQRGEERAGGGGGSA